MNPVAYSLLYMLRSCFRTRAILQLEILALRHQLAVLQKQKKRASLQTSDRLLWVIISRLWKQWQ
jgi:putative transposase